MLHLSLVPRTLITIATALFLAAPAPAVVDGTPIPCSDRRFDCVGLFLTASGECGGFISGTCILIAPDQILIKRHSLDLSSNQPLSAIGDKRFRARFRRDLSGNSENGYFAGGTQCHGVYQEVLISTLIDAPVPGTDTVIANLEQPIANIRPAALELDGTPRAGTPIFLAGWGFAGECFGTGEHWTLRYAHGVLPTDAVGDSFLFTSCGIGSVGPCLSCPSGGPWVEANLHDSGGGIFIEVPSSIPGAVQPELRLIGTVSTTATAHKPKVWNDSGGQPPLVETPPLTAGAISDFNCDGTIDVNDLYAFFTAYFAGACVADVAQSPDLSIEDVLVFITAFFDRR